ncbi:MULTISPECIES: murein biosynthesis integral membrane protein MurJ [unclassified Haematospirillum]|uniref:murein biosynthesis integral membrane protein MurJ n=1 Tax=unclassified Haematospirillum TaxID=2622088 RepID=UPI00143C947D|nr:MULTISPECIES: murein biosynthesis integral membrane protein MurJ [unclassified Haematospirillum]NKD55681.1 murein biosynthesis integral membrane protein MurJ [Haematospirillum sp. H4890]NKD75206.1 murein biosynthesis integral membrane protein MurJ [Haematospirillum sp. H4485]
MALLRSVSIVGFFTLLSRFTGLAREALIAHYLGAGMVTDCFNVAWKLPNLFRRLFAEGAFSAAFVPLFSATLEQEGEDGARVFSNRVFSFLALVLGLFSALMMIAMPWVMHVFAPGFSEIPGKHELASDLAGITFSYLFFVSLCSLLSGVLNSLGRFAAAAGTPVLLNVVSMAGLVWLSDFTPTPGHALAWGTALAGVVQFLWLLHSAWRVGFLPRLVRPSLSPKVRLLLIRIVPVAFGAGLYQVSLLIDVVLASLLPEGSISWLNFADRLNQLPLGVVGIAMGTALLPVLSRQLAASDEAAALDSQNRGVELSLLLTLPAMVGLVLLAEPIVALVYERGAFTAADTEATAAALTAFCLGLPAYVLVKVFTPGFFARGDTSTPFRIAAVALGINVILNLVLMQVMAHVGLALATAIGSTVNAMLLGIVLWRRGHYRMDRRLLQRLPRTLLATSLMGGAVYAVGYAIPLFIPLLSWGVLVVQIVAGLVVFFLSAFLCGSVRREDLAYLRAMRRSQPHA